MKVEQYNLDSVVAGVGNFLMEFGKFAVEMKESNDRRNIEYKKIDGYLPFLSSISWFTSLNLSFHDHESLLFWFLNAPGGEADRETFVDDLFKSCYQENFDYLVSKAVEQFPHRGFAIRPAANAHSEGIYALSIPVFISQAEGIIRETLSAELFSRTTKKQTNIADEAGLRYSQVTQLESWIDYADAGHWIQLKGPLPLAYGPGERADANYTGFNRNTILHGVDNSYASEINSYKSFSLLCHAAGISELLKNEGLAD